MKYLKYIGLTVLAFMLTREVVGLFVWFVLDKKSWADLKKLTRDDVRTELRKELEWYQRPFARTTVVMEGDS